jgi:hypothetical protein
MKPTPRFSRTVLYCIALVLSSGRWILRPIQPRQMR